MKRIAYIDSQIMFRRLLCKEICEYDDNYQIIQYGGGKEFIDDCLHDRNTPLVVVMDVVMREQNGYETMEWLKKFRPHIPVLIFSFIQDVNAFLLLRKLGAKGIVSKNAELQVFLQALHKVTDGEEYYSFAQGAVTSKLSRFNAESGIATLTSTEKKILSLLYQDKTRAEIACDLNISERTFEKHKQNISDKLGIRTREGLLIYAINVGLICPISY